MEWVEILGKGRNTSVLLQEFKKRFVSLSTLDRRMLDTSKVLLFIKCVDLLDQEKVGPSWRQRKGSRPTGPWLRGTTAVSTNGESGVTKGHH